MELKKFTQKKKKKKKIKKKKKSNNLLFKQGLALHKLQNLLVQVPIEVCIFKQKKKKKKSTISHIKDPSILKPYYSPTNPRSLKTLAFHVSSSSFV
jgi:hypothetical protein